jgi:hypothetical protein
MRERRVTGAIALAALLPLVAMVAFQVGYGAGIGNSLLYAAYELGFVLLPGCLAFRALRGPGSRLVTLAIGWALGYVLEILAFNLTAALDARFLFLLYPPVVAVAAFTWIRSRSDRGEPAEPSGEAGGTSNWTIWLTAGMCTAFVAYVAITQFPVARLPGDGSVTYNQDVYWAISLAADIRHHWPLGDPNVSGEGLPYHYFANAHMAAANQVTGVDLPMMFLRFFPLPLAACLVLQFAAAGRLLFGRTSVGLAAAALALFVSELQLDPRGSAYFHAPFAGVSFTLLMASPSFLFGMAIFVPLIALLGERLSRRGEPVPRGAWVLIALFMIGSSDAKVTILPLIIVALAAFAAGSFLWERRLPVVALTAMAIAVVVNGFLYLVQYRGHTSGVTVNVGAGFDYIENMSAVGIVKDGFESVLPDFPGRTAALSVIAIPFGLLGLLAAQLAGIPWIVRRRGPAADAVVWLGVLLAAGLLALFVLEGPGTGNQLYFVYYGLAAGCLLSAAGLRELWLRLPAGTTARRMATALGAVALVLAVVIAGPMLIDPSSGLVAQSHAYLLWYGGLLFAAVTIFLVIRRRPWGSTAMGAALVSALVLGSGLLATPIEQLIPAIRDPAQTSSERTGLTPDLLDGLAWIRDHTSTDDVVAVSNPGVFEFQYAAFSERRIFLGGWGYSQRSKDEGFADVSSGRLNPFANRLALNEAAFAGNDPAALRRMRDEFGVRYLLVDRVNGPPTDVADPGDVGVTVFDNPDAEVIALDRVPSP